MSLTKQVLFSLPAIIIAVTIFILSNGPQPGLPKLGIEWEDKLLHLTSYFIFGLALILFIIANFPNISVKKIALTTIIIGAFYAMSDEIHQYYVPGRHCEFLDWVADLIGVILSTKFIKLLKTKLITI
jgi:VanZ family protein